MNTREDRRFGDLKAAVSATLENYLAEYPEPVLVVTPFKDTPPQIPYETPRAAVSLAEAAKEERTVADNARVHWLSGQVISIGRTSDNDVAFDHVSVSKVHAALREQGDHWEIEDTHSTNGTFVNELQLKPLAPKRLEGGDWVFFGDVCARFLTGQSFWEILQEN